jgi:hypothetical protein
MEWSLVMPSISVIQDEEDEDSRLLELGTNCTNLFGPRGLDGGRSSIPTRRTRAAARWAGPTTQGRHVPPRFSCNPTIFFYSN